MKAIILERKGEYAAVLCEDGSIVKTRCGGEVGETVELSAKTLSFPEAKKRRWMRSAVAAVLALVITGGSLGYLSGTASAYVSVDVEDSSVELTVNHFGRVIAVRAMSDNAQELAEQLRGEVRHQKVEDALNRTMERMHGERRSPAGESAPVIVGVASDSDHWHTQLTQAAEQSAERAGEYTFYVSEASRAEREEALAQQQSVGRFFYERRDPDDRDDDWDDDLDDDREESPVVQPDAPAFGPSGQIPVQPPQGAEDDDGDDDDASSSVPFQQPPSGGGQTPAPFQQPHDEDDDDDAPSAVPPQQPQGGGTPFQQPRDEDSDEDDEDEDDRPSEPPQGQTQNGGQAPEPPQDQPQGGGQSPEPPQGQAQDGGQAPEPPQSQTQDGGQSPEPPQGQPQGGGQAPEPPQGQPQGEGQSPAPPQVPPPGGDKP